MTEDKTTAPDVGSEQSRMKMEALVTQLRVVDRVTDKLQEEAKALRMAVDLQDVESNPTECRESEAPNKQA